MQQANQQAVRGRAYSQRTLSSKHPKLGTCLAVNGARAPSTTGGGDTLPAASLIFEHIFGPCAEHTYVCMYVCMYMCARMSLRVMVCVHQLERRYQALAPDYREQVGVISRKSRGFSGTWNIVFRHGQRIP